MTSAEPVQVFDEKKLEQILGHDYQVIRRLGSGSNRDAWLAKQHGKLRAVLVDINPKTPNSQKTQLKGLDTSNEVAAYERLNNTHENLDAENIIPLVHSINVEHTTGTRRIAVMQYANKGTLEEICKTDISVAQKLALFRDIARAITATHSAGLFQRDIKPTNSVVDLKDGKLRAYLSDFNIAIPMELVTDNTPYSQTRGGHVTVDPTVLVGKPFDVTSDLYSFGKTMLACLTNGPTFEFDRRDGKLIGIDHLNKTTLLTPDGQQIDPVAYKTALKSALSQLPKKAKKIKKMLESMLALEPEKRIKTARRVHELLDSKTTPFWKKEMFWGYAASASAILFLSSWTGGHKLYTHYQEKLRDAQTLKVTATYADDHLNVVNNQTYISATIYDMTNRVAFADIEKLQLPPGVTVEDVKKAVIASAGYRNNRPIIETPHTGAKPIVVQTDEDRKINISFGLKNEPTVNKETLWTSFKGRIYVPGYEGKEFETYIVNRTAYGATSQPVTYKIEDVVPKEFTGSGFIYIDIISPDTDLRRVDLPDYPTYGQAMRSKDGDIEAFRKLTEQYEREKGLQEIDYPNNGQIISRLAIPIVVGTDKLAYIKEAHYFEWHSPMQSKGVTGLQVNYTSGAPAGIRESIAKIPYTLDGTRIEVDDTFSDSIIAQGSGPSDGETKTAILYFNIPENSELPHIRHMARINSTPYNPELKITNYAKLTLALPNDTDYNAFITVRKAIEREAAK